MANWLSKTLQRYENKSKSQRFDSIAKKDNRCLRLCKDTKIKANHNKNKYMEAKDIVV